MNTKLILLSALLAGVACSAADTPPSPDTAEGKLVVKSTERRPSFDHLDTAMGVPSTAFPLVPSIIFFGTSGKTQLILTADGKVEYKGTPDEAATAFIAALRPKLLQLYAEAKK